MAAEALGTRHVDDAACTLVGLAHRRRKTARQLATGGGDRGYGGRASGGFAARPQTINRRPPVAGQLERGWPGPHAGAAAGDERPTRPARWRRGRRGEE